MKHSSIWLLLTLASFVTVATVVSEVPSVISYQGRLTTLTGTPVPDAGYTVVFTIFDAATGGISKWTETQSITTSGGLFSVLLGSVAPIIDTVFNSTTRYLGIKIGADPELTPRIALVAVPYAHRVSTVDGAAGGTISGNLGIGTATPLRRLHIGTGTTVNNVFSDVLLNWADGGDHFYEVANSSGFGFFGISGTNTSIVGSGNLRFSPGAVTAVTMTPTGNVGVGTTSPSDKLHVAGAIRADQFRGPLVVNGGNITYAADGGDHIFSTAVQERMRITVGGNVGIGTTNPSDRLEVGEGGNIVLRATTDDPGDLVFRTSTGVEKGRVWSDPTAGSNKLHLRGGSTTTGLSIDTVGNVFIGQSIKFPDGSTQTTASAAHYIGESYGGGIVFYVYDHGQHGLIAATSDQSTGVEWGPGGLTFARGDGIGAGARNASIMIANQPSTDTGTFAARVCNEYSVTSNGVTYGDWYLPSLHELRLLHAQQAVVGGFAGGTAMYWSSNESNSSANGAWNKRFSDGGEGVNYKLSPEHVRAIRSF